MSLTPIPLDFVIIDMQALQNSRLSAIASIVTNPAIRARTIQLIHFLFADRITTLDIEKKNDFHSATVTLTAYQKPLKQTTLNVPKKVSFTLFKNGSILFKELGNSPYETKESTWMNSIWSQVTVDELCYRITPLSLFSSEPAHILHFADMS